MRQATLIVGDIFRIDIFGALSAFDFLLVSDASAPLFLGFFAFASSAALCLALFFCIDGVGLIEFGRSG